MKIKLLLTAIVLFVLIPANGQEYKHASSTSKINGDQAYILPKAAFSFEVLLMKTTIIPGDSINPNWNATQLSILKRKYGVDEKKYEKVKGKKPSVSYDIAEDSLKVSIKAMPDYDKIYYVNPKAKWNKNQVVSFTYGTDGILTEGESSLENKTFDIVVKGLSGLSAIVGATFKDANGKSAEYKIPTNIESLDNALKKFTKLEGQINYDIYKDLKARYEKEYSVIFAEKFYKEKKEIKVIKFIYIPSSATSVNAMIPIFKLDKTKGTLVFNNALVNQIIAKEAIFDSNTGMSYNLYIEKVREQQSDYYTPRSDNNTGFAYNIPLSAYLKIISPEAEVLSYESVKIPQLGIVGFTNTRKEKLSFQLDPLTGELKKLSIEGKAILTDQVGSVSPLVSDIISNVKGDSEATKLEKEVKQLENEVKKRNLLKELEAQ